MNDQPRERHILPLVKDGTDALDVVSIFYTIQGEGPFVGQPAVFVRFAGCNLQCPACDTDYTTGRNNYTPQQILEQIKSLQPQRSNTPATRPLVVLTGGEPFRQPITDLVELILDQTDCQIQIETNGIIFKDYHKRPGKMLTDMIWGNYRTTIVVSPKTPSINEDIQTYCLNLKYVVDANNIDPQDGLPRGTLGNVYGENKVARPWSSFVGTIYIQPLDEQDPEKNRLNMAAAVEVCMKYGYTLCVQVHKIANLP